MLREVRLYGELGRRFGRVHRLAVSSAAEAVRALCANFAEFEKAVLEVAPAYKVWSGTQRIGDPKDLHGPVGGGEVIRIAPAIQGAKRGGFFQVVLGVALIAASFFLPGAPLFTIGSFAPSLASISFSFGVSLALGGVAQLLSPTPKLDAGSGERPENKPSYVFNGAVNTTAQGNPVPVGYGRMIVGSAVISAGLSATDIPV